MRKILLVAMMLALAALACQVDTTNIEATANAAKNTLVGAVTQAGQQAKTLVAPATGTITGALSYPSDHIPPLRVIAFDAATLKLAASVDTALNQGTYDLHVPAGKYYIVAYTLDGKLAGGYSQMVPCGLNASCSDHSMIPVTVAAGGSAAGIDPGDWYAPAGTFPAMP
jgi:hypothetical protein